MPRAAAVFTGPAEIALTRMFFWPERGLGDAHDVVVGDDTRGSQIGERDDGAAVGHVRRGDASDGDERIGAYVVGERESVSRGFDKRAAQILSIGEGDGVNDGVKFLPGK